MRLPAPRSIRARLRFGLYVINGLLFLAIAVGWWATTQLSQDIRTTLNAMRDGAALSASFSSTVVQELQAAVRYVHTREPGAEESFRRFGWEARRLTLEIDRRVGSTADETVLISAINKHLAMAEAHYARAHRLADTDRIDEARREATLAAPYADSTLTGVRQLGEMTARKVAAVSEELHRITMQRAVLLVVLILGAALLAAVIVQATLGSILGPLRVLVAHAHVLSEGDLAIRTDGTSMPDEFHLLASTLNQAGESLAKLATTEAALREAEKLSAVGLLVSGVAHELNNPLAGILLSVELLLMDPPPGVGLDELHSIREQALRSRSIVRDLLSVVRQRETRKEQVDLRTLVEDASRNVEPHFSALGAKLSLSLPDPLPVVEGDRVGLGQVLINLLYNAVQAAGKGGEVHVSVQVENDRCAIVVEDTGPGIDPEILPRIFEPFFTTKSTGEGSGLGLSVSLGIIQQHGGTLTGGNRTDARTPPFGGARFVATLPCVARPAPEPAEEPEADVQAADALEMEGPAAPRVLVVDDEETIRRTLRRIFTRYGWQVDEAENGAVALERLHLAWARSSDYHLVISDLRMPVFSGVDLYKHVARSRPDLLSRLVFVTGDNVSPDMAEFVTTTQCQVLDKPFEIPTLVGYIERALAT
ncbi:MAG TPA: hybrid sensor histidine kinase/response regulator [Longimicrobiaceae bacterium]|nr:hybrid sensor histidine kinase/response regulator [Longimicrobiaceae bacterium]